MKYMVKRVDKEKKVTEKEEGGEQVEIQVKAMVNI